MTKNPQIIKILRTFSKKEMKSFERFVNSPYFNTSEATVKLFGELKKFYPHFSGDGFVKEKLFAGVYGKRKFSAQLFNKLISNLIKLSLEYISISANTLKYYNLLRGLRNRRLDSLFKSNFQKISKLLENDNLNESDTIYQMIVIGEKSDLELDSHNYYQWEISKTLEMGLSTLYFLERIAANYIEKTNVASGADAEMIKMIKMLNENINYEKLYKQFSGSDFHSKERLKHTLSMILLHKTREERFYREIKSSLFDVPLNRSEIINLGYIYLLDHITYKIKSGDDSYLKERHQVYKKIEGESFATGNVKMLFTFFRNFIVSGINTGDFAWSKYVLRRYGDEIENDGNPGIKFYFEALVSFHAGDYEGALETINKLDLKKITMYKFAVFFDTKFLKCKIYFELNYIEESLAIIDSFEHLLKKDKRLKKDVRSSYNNFVKYYKKLVQCRIKENYDSIINIGEKMKNEKVHEKKWLLEKLGELKNEK